MHLLRLATVEICALGGAAHGVVATTVEIARRERRIGRLSGLVNAVLRKVAAQGPAAWDTLPMPQLPGWWRERMLAAWGEPATLAIEAAHAAGAPLDLTPRDGDAAALAAAVGGEALPTGSVRLTGRAQVSALPGYDTGAFWVQDAAAALPARVLAPAAGETVLDLCAAPGGKTLQLAAAGARVVALDISAARLQRLEANLARTGLQARLVAADALDWSPEAPAPAILLDAPCSASGTIRRHPEMPHLRGSAEVAELAALQARLIDRAAEMLAPGGRLVFCTCSLLPEEGEDQIAAALARHSRLRIDSDATRRPGIPDDWQHDLGLRIRPDHWAGRGGIDGFFIAALRASA